MLIFYDNAAETYYNMLKEKLGDKNVLDDDLLMTYANLRSQEIELQQIVKEEGYRTVNVNSRGKETFQINPSYRAYLACVAEKNKTYSKINKLLAKSNDPSEDEWENF